MKRDKLEQYLDKRVVITLFDGSEFKGILRKTHQAYNKKDINLFIPDKYYYLSDSNPLNVISYLFRCSYVKKIKGDMR